MVGDDKDLFVKTPIQGKVNAANGTSMFMACKGKMNQFLSKASQVRES